MSNIFKTLISSLVITIVLESLQVVRASGDVALKCLEDDNSCLVSTSDSNFAISSPKLSTKGWRAVSVNKENSLIVTDADELKREEGGMPKQDYQFVTRLKNEISGDQGRSFGFSAGKFNTDGKHISRLITSSISMSGYSMSSYGMTLNRFGDITSVDRKQDESYTAMWSDDLPHDWAKLIFINNMVAIAFRNDTVEMVPRNSLSGEELGVIQRMEQQVNERRLRTEEFFLKRASQTL